ncbi:MAG: fibronectin type III domain-containing protein, partial [Kiritimatiellia bacterium]
GSLIDNVRQLGGGGHLGYGSGWNLANREARQWTTPAGGPRLDLVGFTYHHSLAPLLPKSVLRKEIRMFKQAWWKAWGGQSDLSDHSKGFFPTEMAYSRHIIDVLVDEGYEWVIVASHHLSRTCPSYFDQFDLENGSYGIFSSPPNRADLLGPSPSTGWWYSEPNPGNAAWNVSPYAYQLHKVKYVDPETGAEKTMVAVPSDDVLSYRYGYANEGIGKISQYISPYVTDPQRPALVMPSTDGDNAWGGGSSSWFEATPQLFNGAAAAGYVPTTPQDFVNAYGQYAPLAHIEDGAWIFPESDYGSPYFLKWIEPPVAAPGSSQTVPGTVIDMEAPGFALKFWSWAPVITGANWVETAEQILRDEGGSVEDWKIQAPYDWDGTWTQPNEVERAWHIYLAGLDSGFNYYGGLGNDDEVKPALATTRAIQLLQPWLTPSRREQDRTAPSVLKPQRFPYNPGGYTFGWFNSIPGGNTSYLKKMGSEFYIWTHAYDLSGISRMTLKLRLDDDGFNPLQDNANERYAGGDGVGNWVEVNMVQRTLPNDTASLNAAANNGQINYFITPPELADYYFVKVTDTVLPGFRGRLIDYYIEAEDTLGNLHKSEIQHVFVEDDLAVTDPPEVPSAPVAVAAGSRAVQLSWDPVSTAEGYRIFRDGEEIAEQTLRSFLDEGLEPETEYIYRIAAFNAYGSSDASPETGVTTTAAPLPPGVPAPLSAEALSDRTVQLNWDAVSGAALYRIFRNGADAGETQTPGFTDAGLEADTMYTYQIRAENEGGVSELSGSVGVRTAVTPPAFQLGTGAEPSGYLVDSPGMRIFAAVRGTLLFVGTWTPSGGTNDHMIFVSDRREAAAVSAAPWSKAGTTAHPSGKPYLAAEADNQYVGWFNVQGSAEAWRDPQAGGRMEGVMDMVEVFGAVPERIFIAAVAYETAANGRIAAQAPLGNDDPNLDPEEFMEFAVDALRDSAADGVFDRLDPDRDFVVRPLVEGGNLPGIRVPVVPGKSYRLLQSNELQAGEWTEVMRFRAGSGENEKTIEIPLSSPFSFYRLEALP